MRSLKNILNKALDTVGLRIVNSDWGPRGEFATLRNVRDCGITPKLIVDIGASTGVWTETCMEIFPEASYLLIDPLDKNQSRLNDLAKRHRNLTVWQGAAGSAEAVLNFQEYGDQSSFFSGELSQDKTNKIQVEVKPLDKVLQDLSMPQPDLIKADVQGYELEVLKGAENALENCQLLLLECSIQEIYDEIPLMAEIISYAFKFDYQIFDICTYSQRPFDKKLCNADILFAKRSNKNLFVPGYFSRSVDQKRIET
jgi:FkbM family methyltransferase